jgi:hypothetical protein
MRSSHFQVHFPFKSVLVKVTFSLFSFTSGSAGASSTTKSLSSSSSALDTNVVSGVEFCLQKTNLYLQSLRIVKNVTLVLFLAHLLLA